MLSTVTGRCWQDDERTHALKSFRASILDQRKQMRRQNDAQRLQVKKVVHAVHVNVLATVTVNYKGPWCTVDCCCSFREQATDKSYLLLPWMCASDGGAHEPGRQGQDA